MFKSGQRWRWVFNDSVNRSNLIIEIIKNEDYTQFMVVQIISSNDMRDSIGKIYSVYEEKWRFTRTEAFSFYRDSKMFLLNNQSSPQKEK